jgi:hypothetical protein
MQRERLLARVALGTVLVLLLAGCASGKIRLDLAKSCQAHGGTWSQTQETCTMSVVGAGGAAKRAREICAAQGGDYLTGGTCMLEGVK